MREQGEKERLARDLWRYFFQSACTPSQLTLERRGAWALALRPACAARCCVGSRTKPSRVTLYFLSASIPPLDPRRTVPSPPPRAPPALPPCGLHPPPRVRCIRRLGSRRLAYTAFAFAASDRVQPASPPLAAMTVPRWQRASGLAALSETSMSFCRRASSSPLPGCFLG